jgi:hypothetical protein
MKSILFYFLFFLPFLSFGQLLSGPLMDEGRKLITTTNFIVEDSREGVIIFNVAVDRTGKVSSAKVVSSETTVVSTPARIIATNYVKALQFQEGTYYPEFHQVKIKVTLKAPVMSMPANQE